MNGWPDTLPSWLAGAFLIALTLTCVWHAAHDMADDHDGRTQRDND